MTIENKIEAKLDTILKDKFKCSEEKIKMIKGKETRLLSSEIGFSAANLFELFLEIESEYGISFSEEELLSFDFDQYRELLEKIEKKIGGN